jgi:UDP-N-acetylglucosamine:LPS N-acetylglucosamine transferase
VASGGGHFEQILACMDALEGCEVALSYYGYPTFDDFSHAGVARLRPVKFVGWHGVSLALNMVVGFFQWLWILATERPDVIFSTGAEVAIVPIIVGKCLLRSRTIFLETASRKENPSRTGKLVYPFCDAFFVQSPALLKHYGPRARYVGSLL